jgi:hypothetical protein
MGKATIIGHVGHGITLQSAIDSVLEKERGIVIVEKRNPFEPEPMVIHNYRDCFIDKDFEKQIKLLNNKPKSKYHK